MVLGFRISAVLALTLGHVLHHGLVRSHVATTCPGDCTAEFPFPWLD